VTDMPKFCIDCRHCQALSGAATGYFCRASGTPDWDVVTGVDRMQYKTCDDMRLGPCGREAKLFYDAKP